MAEAGTIWANARVHCAGPPASRRGTIEPDAVEIAGGLSRLDFVDLAAADRTLVQALAGAPAITIARHARKP